ncbi:MAG: hypothetical protein ACM3PV_04660 [Betaproteobacteria bacterium]
MRLALWTPRPARGWLAGVVPQLERAARLVVVADESRPRPQVDVDLYHVANDPAHGFVYRALLERPGLVVLEDWRLHELVLAETAGRGDPDAYRREARRSRGATGEFIARQVLRGLGGELPSLLALNERVLEASLALAVTRAGDLPRAAACVAGRPFVQLPLGAGDAGPAAAALIALAREALPRLPAALRAARLRQAAEATPLGRALGELRPLARELGLAELPPGSVGRVAALLPGPPEAGES